MADNLCGSEAKHSNHNVENVIRGEIVNVIRITGKKKNSRLLKTGDMYLFYTTDHTKRLRESVYRCRRYSYRSLPCPARLIYRDGVYRNSLESHNHRNEVVEISQIEFTNECCRRVRERRAPGGLKGIFEQVRNERPEVNVEFEGALERRMQRIKKGNNPRPVDRAIQIPPAEVQVQPTNEVREEVAPLDRAAVGGPRGNPNPAENEEHPQAPAPLRCPICLFNQVVWSCGPSSVVTIVSFLNMQVDLRQQLVSQKENVISGNRYRIEG
ncbi:hypothetical protein DAPPUDRAFT_221453 [Daphnia pulex]|uniref:Uncharacterized protein n=1 Tax=Daphnia pulex TaxID=6669 RepID=E9FY99_DAPPU|nr:hypothetical protein DAPPUDRAFT_221453 [Daphnia pulex]|eukprot:EFX87812.1 hypothetical protein DAPPUDRAFT_221453 [Daphnia pulex]